MEKIVSELKQIVSDVFGVTVESDVTRPDARFGDFSSNVALKLAKDLGRAPREIAEELVPKINQLTDVASAEVAGLGFINIRLTDIALEQMSARRPVQSRQAETVVIETNNPNPFKAMHIGHAMNAIVADTIANLLEASGAHTYRVSYHGDVGLHVGKSMYALLRYAGGNPQKLSDVPEQQRNEFMSRMYAEGSRAYSEDEVAKSEIVELARQSFKREDPVYASVYDTVFAWSFEEIDANMRRLGNQPVERRFLESDADLRGVKIVRDNTPRVFQESDGALVFKGSEHGSFDNAFVSSNGQGLYAARDLGLIQLKNEQYHPNKSYIVTAEEQRDYFKGVLAAAGLAMPELKDVTVNIPTGMVKLSSGKMSSRDGGVVTIAWLFEQVAEAIRARGAEPTESVIAGALRYAFLKVRIGGDVIFDINESVSIQGNSGPYLQYAHARACSILEKAGEFTASAVNYDDAERSLLQKISEYSEVAEKAMTELLPHHVCTYLYELAQEFNRFYEKCRILGDERETVRLGLVRRYRDTLADGLKLLGIEAPERL